MLTSRQLWLAAQVSIHNIQHIQDSIFSIAVLLKQLAQITEICSLPGANGVNMYVSAADSFNYKTFFKACGLSAKSEADVKKAFLIIDQDNSGFIEEEELK